MVFALEVGPPPTSWAKSYALASHFKFGSASVGGPIREKHGHDLKLPWNHGMFFFGENPTNLEVHGTISTENGWHFF